MGGDGLSDRCEVGVRLLAEGLSVVRDLVAESVALDQPHPLCDGIADHAAVNDIAVRLIRRLIAVVLPACCTDPSVVCDTAAVVALIESRIGVLREGIEPGRIIRGPVHGCEGHHHVRLRPGQGGGLVVLAQVPVTTGCIRLDVRPLRELASLTGPVRVRKNKPEQRGIRSRMCQGFPEMEEGQAPWPEAC